MFLLLRASGSRLTSTIGSSVNSTSLRASRYNPCMRCIAIRPVAFEDLGTFEPVLREHGFDVEYRQPCVDTLDPQSWLQAELLVLLGGPVSVYEQDRYPWLRQLIDGTQRRLALDLPTLGVCLGAQLMAAALRGDVHPGRAREIGWGGVNLTESGHASALRHLDGMPVLHWHGDVFELPDGAERLAWTDVTPNQAFARGPNVLALQLHAEADASRIESWLIGHAGELAREGLSPETLRQDSVRLGAQAALAGQAMLRDWLRSLNK